MERILRAGVCCLALGLGCVGVLAEIPGQIAIDPGHPEWFVRADRSPYFLCGPGDPEGFLYLGAQQPDGTRSGGEQTEKIQRLIDTGGNSIYLTAIRSDGGDGDSTENPFVDNDPALGLNEAVLSQWDGWFDQMDAGGITIFFLFYDDGACVWGCARSTDHVVPAEEQAFMTAIVNRFDHYRNLIWITSEEYSEAYSKERTSNHAALIRAADDHDHPIGTTQHTGLQFDFPNDPNMELFGIQCRNPGGGSCDGTTTPAAINESMNRAWEDAAGRHNITLSEIRYEGTGVGERARQLMWASAMGGAYFMAQGWRLENSNNPPDSNLAECRLLNDFMESVPLAGMAPDNSRVTDDADYALLDAAVGAYVLYSDSYTAGIGLDLLPAGSYGLRWLDTVTGATHDAIHDQPAPAPATFERPAELGAATEIALYIGPGLADPDNDGVLVVSDNCPMNWNPGQEDTDADGPGDICDNCPFVPNPMQSDFDTDLEGDFCDTDDAVIYLTSQETDRVRWDDEQGFDLWNVYRGDLGLLRSGGEYTQDPGLVPLADRTCGTAQTEELVGLPAPGEAIFVLVTGRDALSMMEGGLGQASSGATRTNANPCPAP